MNWLQWCQAESVREKLRREKNMRAVAERTKGKIVHRLKRMFPRTQFKELIALQWEIDGENIRLKIDDQLSIMLDSHFTGSMMDWYERTFLVVCSKEHAERKEFATPGELAMAIAAFETDKTKRKD